MPMKLKEPINLLACNYITSLDNDNLIDIIHEEGYKYEESLKYIRSVRNFCSAVIKAAGDKSTFYHPQTYRFAKNKSDGRRYVSAGLQNMHRDVRGLLCRDKSVDYDMVNAHPTILLHLAKCENITAPYLQSYVNDRSSFLERNNVDKRHVIKLINTDSHTKLITNNNDILNLANEISTIREILYVKNKANIRTDKRYNVKSSVLNHFLCVHEDALIQRVYKKFPNGFHALCFDGFLFDKDKPIDIRDLNDITKDYGIEWSTKPLSDRIVIPHDFVPNSYEDIKKRFENEHAICLDPMCFIKKTEYCDLLFNRSHFMDAVATWEVPSQSDERKNVFDLTKWIRDPTRKEFEKMAFTPFLTTDPTPANVYNTFRPFGATYVKKGERHSETHAFMSHLDVNMCNHDKGSATWLFNLFAWRFQHPNSLPKCAVVLKGREGAGKDLTIDILAKIMGRDNDYIHRSSDMKELYGDFNCDIKNKLIVQCNEVEGKSGVEYKEKLKDTITRDKNRIRELYLKPYKMKNVVLIIVCSNNLTPIVIPFDDRRWVVFQTGRDNIGVKEYWDWFAGLTQDEHWINSLYSEFLDADLEHFQPDDLSQQPRTEAYISSQEDNIPVVYKYLNETNFDVSFQYIGQESSKHFGLYMVESKQLTDNINDWIDYQGLDYRINSKQIIKLLREITGVQTSVNLRVNNKQSRYILFNRKEVEYELTNRIFKNIAIQPIESLDMPCLIEDDPLENLVLSN